MGRPAAPVVTGRISKLIMQNKFRNPKFNATEEFDDLGQLLELREIHRRLGEEGDSDNAPVETHFFTEYTSDDGQIVEKQSEVSFAHPVGSPATRRVCIVCALIPVWSVHTNVTGPEDFLCKECLEWVGYRK